MGKNALLHNYLQEYAAFKAKQYKTDYLIKVKNFNIFILKLLELITIFVECMKVPTFCGNFAKIVEGVGCHVLQC